MSKKIISASRRTDIPAFYTDWFTNRLEQGYLYVKSPYSNRLNRVSLQPDDIHSIVFWSKNFSPLISRLESIERVVRKLFFHFTITGVPENIELNTPDHKDAAKDLIYLSKRYSPGHVIWRFDPIILTDKVPFEHYEESFIRCAEMIKGYVKECYISFAHPYKKVLVNFERHTKHELLNLPAQEKRAYAERLSLIAEKYGLRLFACCNDYILSNKVYKGSCINGKYLAGLFNDNSIRTEPAPTRKECACSRSVDIGSYDTCPHGCLYCYANANKDKAQLSYKQHDVEWNGLGFNVEEETSQHDERQLLF